MNNGFRLKQTGASEFLKHSLENGKKSLVKKNLFIFLGLQNGIVSEDVFEVLHFLSLKPVDVSQSQFNQSSVCHTQQQQ